MGVGRTMGYQIDNSNFVAFFSREGIESVGMVYFHLKRSARSCAFHTGLFRSVGPRGGNLARKLADFACQGGSVHVNVITRAHDRK